MNAEYDILSEQQIAKDRATLQANAAWMTTVSATWARAVLASHEALRRERDHWKTAYQTAFDNVERESTVLEADLARAEAKAAEDEVRFHAALADGWIERDTLRGRVEALTQALREYGDHAPGCSTPRWPNHTAGEATECTCGVRAVLAAGETEGVAAMPMAVGIDNPSRGRRD